MSIQWFCEHCGSYFPDPASVTAATSTDTCPCGATVNAEVGVAQLPDGHRWTPAGAPECQECLVAFVRRVADLHKGDVQLNFDDDDDPEWDPTANALFALIVEARQLLGRPAIVDAGALG